VRKSGRSRRTDARWAGSGSDAVVIADEAHRRRQVFSERYVPA
jgi:hypothetical protein